MTLFKSDLLRAFTIGFLLGSAALVAMMGSPFEQSIADQVIPAAVAAAPSLPDQTMVAP
ncbi:MAG: hypothetical protein ABL914_03555 [Novosphingobium sp.]|uniref:hypothetical protein n=1 Tax=Novosphingobium sp. TaxID=1874826 RepID=UPI0032B999E7